MNSPAFFAYIGCRTSESTLLQMLIAAKKKSGRLNMVLSFYWYFTLKGKKKSMDLFNTVSHLLDMQLE